MYNVFSELCYTLPKSDWDCSGGPGCFVTKDEGRASRCQ